MMAIIMKNFYVICCYITGLALMRLKEKLGLSADTHRLPVVIFANVVGLTVSLLLPFFFPPEQRTEALFALPIPVWALLSGIIIPSFICLFKDIRSGITCFPSV